MMTQSDWIGIAFFVAISIIQLLVFVWVLNKGLKRKNDDSDQ